MFTGIVQGLLPITTMERKSDLLSFAIQFPEPLMDGLATGASVAIDGVCLTVSAMQNQLVSFDAVPETMNLTTIGALQQGSLVNVERSAKQGVEVGGHIVSGHVFDVAEITAVASTPNNREMTFQGAERWMKYVFLKGFLALNGASLTVSQVDKERHQFGVSLIPEPLQRTNFGTLSVGDRVNVEIDNQTQIIVDTVTNVLADKLASGQLVL